MEKIKNKLEDAKLWDKIVEHELHALWKYGVERISNSAIKNSVVDFLEEEAPLGFFVNTVSRTSKHHPKWQCQKAGILRNTTECCLAAKMQLQIYKEFCDENDQVLPEPLDIVLAATILSDTFKYDNDILISKMSREKARLNRDHGKIAANIWRDKYAKRHKIGSAVEKEIFNATYWHLGRWTNGWTTKTKLPLLSEIVHRLDMIFTDKSLELLYNPKREIK
ncbi:MAG: hypothetical protein Q7S12_01425 [bacterium]|nr:hypothetical protein [bacterium]